jgi:hypothetical protein
MSQPEYLYKYTSVARLEEILTQGRIFFPTPADFNDPFDGKVRQKKTPRRKRERYNRDLLRDRQPRMPKHLRKELAKRASISDDEDKRFSNRIHQGVGILCLTEKRDNVLMWSHYAEKHTGVFLEFHGFSLTGSSTFPPLPVRYSDEYPVVDLFEMKHLVNGNDPLASSKQREIVECIYLTKAKGWEYECEWRVVDLVGAHFAGRGRGFRRISLEQLTGVVLGCRTPNSHKIKIRELIALGNIHPTLYEARESADSFALEVIEVP